MTPEFSRPERLDTIGDAPRTVWVEADETERRRLAGRFGLVAVARLEAEFTLDRDAAGVRAEGRVRAAVTQTCSVTGDPVEADVDEPLNLRFVEESDHLDEAELDDTAIDTVEIEGGEIDLGETAAETLALALDPYPRSSAAAQALKAAGVVAEEEAGAFGGLAALRNQLGG